mmetsp:Transcript_92044/g.231434  ORF Transcript_92044/g.231434 Transcript_92044/m.231434 type:complete len:225 (+) Transcript_92044:434-1108(+)
MCEKIRKGVDSRWLVVDEVTSSASDVQRQHCVAWQLPQLAKSKIPRLTCIILQHEHFCLLIAQTPHPLDRITAWPTSPCAGGAQSRGPKSVAVRRRCPAEVNCLFSHPQLEFAENSQGNAGMRHMKWIQAILNTFILIVRHLQTYAVILGHIEKAPACTMLCGISSFKQSLQLLIKATNAISAPQMSPHNYACVLLKVNYYSEGHLEKFPLLVHLLHRRFQVER